MAKRYWESIKASVLTSFYTDTRIVNAIADSIEKTGVTFRTCLDPSLGMGAFAETLAPNEDHLVDQHEDNRDDRGERDDQEDRDRDPPLIEGHRGCAERARAEKEKEERVAKLPRFAPIGPEKQGSPHECGEPQRYVIHEYQLPNFARSA